MTRKFDELKLELAILKALAAPHRAAVVRNIIRRDFPGIMTSHITYRLNKLVERGMLTGRYRYYVTQLEYQTTSAGADLLANLEKQLNAHVTRDS